MLVDVGQLLEPRQSFACGPFLRLDVGEGHPFVSGHLLPEPERLDGAEYVTPMLGEQVLQSQVLPALRAGSSELRRGPGDGELQGPLLIGAQEPALTGLL